MSTGKRLALIIAAALLIAWGAFAIGWDHAWARTPGLPCGWTVSRGIASHTGYGYPWKLTAELRKSWGELPSHFDVAAIDETRAIALHEVYTDRSLIGRWVLVTSPTAAIWAQVLDAMAATWVVADLDPRLLMALNGGVLRGGLEVAVWIPTC